MKFIRKFLFIAALLSTLWLGIFIYNRITDGFSIHQMTSSLPPCPQFELTLSEQEKQFLLSQLDQNFRYIGKGCQFYAFESEDGKYIIKFLKHKHLRPFTWLNKIPMPHQLKVLCQEKIKRRELRVERLLTSCKIAYEKLKNETQILYIHLNRTPILNKKVTLIDKLGFKHRIELDDFEYVIQKKGITVKECFAQIDKSEVNKKVEQLMDLVKSRCAKGIGDRDRSFVQNVAFSTEDERAFFVDIGQFYEDPTLVEGEEQIKDLQKRLNNLRYWTEKHFPTLFSYLSSLLEGERDQTFVACGLA